MTGARGWTVSMIALGLCLACDDTAQCKMQANFYFSASVRGDPPKEFCDVTLSDPENPEHKAVYRYLSTAPKRHFISSPPLDRYVDCTVIQGPKPTYCQQNDDRWGVLGFVESDATALESFLGTDTFDQFVSCDGGYDDVIEEVVTDAGLVSRDKLTKIGCYVN